MRRHHIIGGLLGVLFCLIAWPLHIAARPLLILDPGHGGSDQGGYDGRGFVLGTTRIPEDAYTYDIAKRIERMGKEKGWEIWFTVIDPEYRPIANQTNDTILLPAKKMHYNEPHAHTIIYSGKEGLLKRLDAADYGYQRSKQKEALFISLHFDYAPDYISGAHIFTGEHQDSHQFVTTLTRYLKQNGLGLFTRGKEQYAIVSKNQLFMLAHNTIIPRVLIELGNYNDPRDRSLMLEAQGRETYARILVGAIDEYIKSIFK